MMKEKTAQGAATAVAAFREAFHSEPVRKLGVCLLYIAAGFWFSRSTVFGQYAPFGVVMVSAVPYGNLWFAAAGAVLGYLFSPLLSIPARYIAAVLAVAAIRWTLNDLDRLKKHFAFAPMVTFLPMLATGLTIVFANNTMRNAAAMYVAEALLSAGSAYFFARTSKLITERRGPAAMDVQDIASLAVVVSAAVLVFAGMEIWRVSVIHVVAGLMVLFLSRFGGIAAGAVAGIAAGAVISLSSVGLTYLSGAYALGGLMAGIFAPVGRLAGAVAYLIANGIASLQVGNEPAVIDGMYSAAAAAVLFLACPVRRFRLPALFRKPDDAAQTDGLRRSVILKLSHASHALGNVSETVEEISGKLSSLCAPDINGVYRLAVEEACMGCGLKLYCWEKNYHENMDALQNLTPVFRKNGMVTAEDFLPPLRERCGRLPELVASVNQRYREFMAREAAERRVAQVREMVAEQFQTTAQILGDLSRELELFERFDFQAAIRVGEILRAHGAVPIDVSCRVDRYGRMTVEAEVTKPKKKNWNRPALVREISNVCGRTFSPPCISVTAKLCKLQMSERPALHVTVGTAQHVCGGGELCGDSYACFQDGAGRQLAIVSDGMGTGGRAAVDGAMATGVMEMLLKAGIGFDCALRIVNSALIAKSGDESLATVDVAAFDLFSGKLELRKAGAPVSFLRKNGQTVRVEAPALPVGILKDAEFAKTEADLARGDLIVLVTDGAVSAGDKWLGSLLEEWEESDPQLLAEEIVRRAQGERADGHDDDITALVLRVDEPRDVM